jgi:hypothetical protein
MPPTREQPRPPIPLPPGDLIELRRSGQYLWVSPPIGGLEEFLYTVRHVRVHDGERGTIVPLRDPLVWPATRRGRPALQCFAGLTPLVRELLETCGFRVRLTGDAPAPLPAPDLDRLAGFGRIDHGLLRFVRDHDRGLIRAVPGGKVSVARLLAQVALAWPKKRIIVVAGRIADARRLRRRLAGYLSRVGLTTSRDPTPRARRVIVATPSRLGQGQVGIERRHIYIALNPEELFAGLRGFGIEGIRGLWRGRLYGLLPTDRRLAPRQRDLVTALFGADEVVVPRHGRAPLAVEVVFSRIAGGARPPHRDGALVKRTGVHEHALRNRRLCQLARALAVRDRALLGAKFPEVAGRLGGKVGRVGVLVDHVGHGLALARLLGWPLVAGAVVHEGGLTEEEQAILRRGRDEHQRRKVPVVVTGEGMRRAGRFDVLVRADAGVGLPAIPAPRLCAPRGRPGRLLLVDFKDEHHPLLRRWSGRRRTAYEEAGWAVAGSKPTSPLERFLASRPEVV